MAGSPFAIRLWGYYASTRWTSREKPTMRNSRWLFVPVVLAVCACPAPAVAGFVYAVIDPTGSNGLEVDVNGLNASGQATGSYLDLDGTYHGYVRDATGSITTFAPGVTATFALAINGAGEVAGSYNDTRNHIHGFLRDPGGSITTFDVPGSIRTAILSLNDSGASAGIYTDANNMVHGFIRQADGTVATFDGPPGSTRTLVNSTGAASGVATGAYADASGTFHGFLRAANGTITLFDSPGSLNTPALLNNAGLVAGTYNVGGFPYSRLPARPIRDDCLVRRPGGHQHHYQRPEQRTRRSLVASTITSASVRNLDGGRSPSHWCQAISEGEPTSPR